MLWPWLSRGWVLPVNRSHRNRSQKVLGKKKNEEGNYASLWQKIQEFGRALFTEYTFALSRGNLVPSLVSKHVENFSHSLVSHQMGFWQVYSCVCYVLN